MASGILYTSAYVEMSQISLWDFSLQFYSDKKIESVLLNWQNNFQINVCVVLWVCWLGQRNLNISRDVFMDGVTIAHDIDDKVLSLLRLARNNTASSKLPDEARIAVKKNVLATELLIEKDLLNKLDNVAKQNKLADNLSGLSKEVMFEHYLNVKKIKASSSICKEFEKLVSQR